MRSEKSGKIRYHLADRYPISSPVQKLVTVLQNSICNFPTCEEISDLFFRTVFNFPTSGEISDRFEERYVTSLAVGKLVTVLQNGI